MHFTNGLLPLSPWASWLLIVIIVILAIWLGNEICWYWIERHIFRCKTMPAELKCWNCETVKTSKNKQLKNVKEGSPCPLCKQGFFLKFWKV